MGGAVIEHRPAIKRENAIASEAAEADEQVDRQVIGAARLRIIPQRHLGVVAQQRWIRRINLQRVEVPRPRYGIGGLRHPNALKERPIRPGEGEVSYHPAISDLIIENKRVSLVLVRTRGTH